MLVEAPDWLLNGVDVALDEQSCVIILHGADLSGAGSNNWFLFVFLNSWIWRSFELQMVSRP